MRFIAVIGEPGIGKTTAVAAVLGQGIPSKVGGVPLLTHAGRVGEREWIQIGAARDGGFGGTDALAMDIQPNVLAWLAATKPPLVLAEGDRLANGKFFLAVQELGYDLLVVYLAAPPAVTTARRAGRRSNQNAKWVQGRVTKVRNLVQDVRWPVVRVDADQSTSDVTIALALAMYGSRAEP